MRTTARKAIRAAADEHGWTLTTGTLGIVDEYHKGSRRIRINFTLTEAVYGGSYLPGGTRLYLIAGRNKAVRIIAWLSGDASQKI